jgi:hypothetical protein
MPTPLTFHFQYLDRLLSAKKRKNPLGIRLHNGWYARKANDELWQVGRYSTWGQGPPQTNSNGQTYTPWTRLPKDQWTFCPYYTVERDRIIWNPDGVQYGRLRTYSQSRKNCAVPSSIYSLSPSYGGRVETISVQGQGPVILEHTNDGIPTRFYTAYLPVKKVWDKEKYLELRRKRVKAERILRSMCKMGAFETEKAKWTRTDDAITHDYQALLQQLVDDKNPSAKTMELLARMVQGRIQQMTRYHYNYNLHKSEEIIPTPDQAFAALRDDLRKHSYKLEKVYTYEPFDDGRHEHRFENPVP